MADRYASLSKNTYMKYSAITIDTSIFDRHALKLESGLLKRLSQFSNGPFRLILSEVVVKEVLRHLEESIFKAKQSLDAALKKASDQLSVNAEDVLQCKEKLLLKVEPGKLADGRMSVFLQNTRAEIVKAENNVRLQDVLSRYFDSLAPFSGSGKKKSEFPDAIALLSVESWAKEKKIKVLAVSTDNDWNNFAEKSSNIDVTDDLGYALTLFQQHSAAIKYCERLSAQLSSNSTNELAKQIDSFIASKVEDTSFYAESTTSYLEPHYASATYEKFEFVRGVDESVNIKLINANENSIIIEISTIVNGVARANFIFTRPDLDRGLVRVGSSDAQTDFQIWADILITLEGNYESSESMNVSEIELSSFTDRIDFGHIDMQRLE